MPRVACLAFAVLCACTSLAPAAAVPPSNRVWAKSSQGRFAYGMYFREKKVGWTIEEIKLGKHDGQDVLFSSSESYMVTLFDGEKSVKEEKSLTCYELTGDGRIVFADNLRRDDGKEVLRRVERVGDRLRITTRQGGRALARTVPMPKDTVAHQRELESWMQGPRRKGDRFTKYSTAWDQNDVDQKQVYLFRQTKKVLLSGLATPGGGPHRAGGRQPPFEVVYDVEINLDGGRLDAVLLPDTRTISASMGGLLSMRLEKEAVARKLDGKPIDLMDITSIHVDRRLGRARHVDRLQLELTGVSDLTLPASHRQRVKPSKGGVVTVEVLRDFRAEKPAGLSKKEKVEHTKTTPRFQCEHEQVKDLARKIVGGEKDVLKAARKIEAWVYENLKKSYADNADTALEVLDHKAGDCTEHALLFVALARAAGIPAREVGGLAYLDGTRPAFGWHAWAEVHDGHQWVSIDPTWNQVYVDATHLKLSDGERDLAWTNVVGTIKIKVVDVQTRR